VADRVAQTVAALTLEPRTESIFHDDSYGYRPGRGALDAVAKCRERCWSTSWVIDLDVRKFFDSVAWDLMVKAVQANVTHEQRWIVLYVKRWLAAPIRTPEGRLVERERGTPQGSLCSAEHNDPYEQRRVMRSAGRQGAVTAILGVDHCA
jgi:retron-type reverse transcriptase